MFDSRQAGEAFYKYKTNGKKSLSKRLIDLTVLKKKETTTPIHKSNPKQN